MLSEQGGLATARQLLWSLTVWPGKWSSDVFELDDRSLARRVLQQATYVSLADLEYAEHHEGRHRARARPTCKLCQEHLNGDHAKPPYGPTFCQNSGCPVN